jgi:hypothetical protein
MKIQIISNLLWMQDRLQCFQLCNRDQNLVRKQQTKGSSFRHLQLYQMHHNPDEIKIMIHLAVLNLIK